MRFTSPLALLLLAVLPVLAYLGWPARGASRRREVFSLALRLALTLCLVLALAGMEIIQPSQSLAVVFLIDLSDSMPVAYKAAEVEYVRQALKSMKPDDQAAVVVFGADALVERPMSSSRELPDITSAPVTSATDLAAAMRLALALYPPGAARRMVILSDGADTVSGGLAGSPSGPVSEVARLAAASGVEVDALPFVVSSKNDTAITAVTAPSHVRQGESFDLKITVEAANPTTASIRVLSGGQVIYEGQYNLQRGVQSFSLPLKAGTPGFASYTVQISPDRAQDSYYQNDVLSTYSQVDGPPRVLVVAPPAGEPLGFQGQTRPDEYSALVAALNAAGYQVDQAEPTGLSFELSNLAAYASIVLVDVPARELNNRQMEALQSYVRDLGGGLVAVGGPTSYGVGGYFRTPLEETLPVEMQIKDDQRRPTLAMLFIIDHSGSMAESSGGVVKVELAKEAAIRSVSLLSPMDRVGVIAFDETASWVVNMTDLSNPDQVIRMIGTIRPAGGTNIYNAIQAMAGVLPNDPAIVKHAILLTDGGADPTGIPELVSSLNKNYGITLSTVAIGQDAAPWLEQVAQLGGGRYHFTADPSAIPSIFTEETTLATRAYIIEENFFPKKAADSPILSNITETPPLHGYVGTTAKAAAQTILVSDKGDPILAAWQYGLGRAVAFTSDATGRWASDWVSWQSFPTFWAQAVGYTTGQRVRSPLSIQVEQQGKTGHVVVDARTPGGEFLNNYTLKANVIDPQGQATSIQLQQVAPGRYTGDFQPGQPGAYLLRVDGSDPQGTVVGDTAGWSLSYSPEYLPNNTDPDALVRLVNQAGGKILSLDMNNQLSPFAHTLAAPRATRPTWPWLLALAAILLPVDIASRRLALTWADVRRGFARLIEKLAVQRQAAPAAAHTERMETLLQAKEKARSQSGMSQPEAPPVEPKPAPIQKPVLPEMPLPPRTERPAAPVPSEAHQEELTPAAPEPGSTASQLLARKRARREK